MYGTLFKILDTQQEVKILDQEGEESYEECDNVKEE